MLLIEPAREYERALLRGIMRYSQRHGPWVFFREKPFWETQPRKSLIAQIGTVDGIVMRECSGLREILGVGKPTIVSPYATERIPASGCIVSDHVAMGRMAAEHLLERGFRHFAFCGYDRVFWSRQRCEGFRDRIAFAGFATHRYRSPRLGRRMSWNNEQQLLMDWLVSLPKPVAVMACVDERSQQVAEACKTAQLAVPDQVAIVGVDNDEFLCCLSNLPLSSVAIDAERAGFQSAALLAALMAGCRAQNRVITVEPIRVVTRVSSDIFAVDDPHVARALRCIREGCRQAIRVIDVVRSAGLSRRVLEKRFQSSLNRTIGQEIRRQRVDQIASMLLNTDLSIADIAAALGYQDAAHIARYFSRVNAVSPQTYRRQHRRSYG